MGKRILLAAVLLAFSVAWANSPAREVGLQGYVGLGFDSVLFIPGLQLRGGLNNLLIPNLGVRGEIGFYLSGLTNVGLSALYHMPPLSEQVPLSFYGGLGPRLLLSMTDQGGQRFFSLGGFLGGEYKFRGLNFFLEFSGTTYFLYQITVIPGLTLGVNLYF